MSSAAALYNQNAVSRSLNSYWSTRNRLHHLVRKCFSLFALLYLGRDGTCMTCSVAITDHSHHNSHHRLVDRWKNKKKWFDQCADNHQTQLGWRCSSWAKDERKLSVYFMLATHSFFFIGMRDKTDAYTRQYVSYRYTTVNYTSTCYLFFFYNFQHMLIVMQMVMVRQWFSSHLFRNLALPQEYIGFWLNQIFNLKI